MSQKSISTHGDIEYHYTIDIIRFLSASSVAAFHLLFYSWASGPASSTAHAFQGAASFESATPWTWFGWIGVEVFFVISGFVIANSAVGVSSGAFLKSRALRLLPAAWICATITFAVRDAGGVDTLAGLIGPYLSSLSLFPAGPWIDGVYWSLAVEITFYALVFGLLRFGALRLLPALAWGLTLANGTFFFLGATGLYWRVPGWFQISAAAEPLLLRHGALFAIGIWMWLSSKRRLPLSGALGLCLAVPVAWFEIWGRGAALQTGEAPAAAGQPLVLPILIWTALTVLLFVVTRQPARFTPRSETVRTWLRRMGLATYPLYLLHNDVGVTLVRTMVLAGAPKWLALALAVLIVLGLVFGVALVLEPRLRRALRRAIERVTEGRASSPRAAVAPRERRSSHDGGASPLGGPPHLSVGGSDGRSAGQLS